MLHQEWTGSRDAAATGEVPRRQAPGRIRRRLRGRQRGTATGRAAPGPGAHRLRHAPAAGCPVVRLALSAAASRSERATALVGTAAGAAASGGPLAREVAGGPSLPVRAGRPGGVEGGRLPVGGGGV